MAIVSCVCIGMFWLYTTVSVVKTLPSCVNSLMGACTSILPVVNFSCAGWRKTCWQIFVLKETRFLFSGLYLLLQFVSIKVLMCSMR